MKFGKLELFDKKPLLILEAGVNHEGVLNKALEMIDAAADAGGDIIKFQSYKAEGLASKNSPAYWDQQKEPSKSQFELFKKYDRFGEKEYELLAQRCREKDILFASTAFDNNFVDILDPLMSVYKVASADLTNRLLLSKIATKKKPVILSTGASFLSEVEETIRFLRENGVEHIGLLHCVLEYPTSSANANLETITYLKKVFHDCVIGYSDHVPPLYNCQTLLVAWLKGAQIIEKHFTLDKTNVGNDHYHAMDPDDVKDFLERQQNAADLLGSEYKTCLPCEEKARTHARRSIVLAKNVPKDHVLTLDDLAAKRPGVGLSPDLLNLIIGRKTRRELIEDTVLQWRDLV